MKTKENTPMREVETAWLPSWNAQKRGCRDICRGNYRKGMFMSSLISWLAHSEHIPPIYEGREWIAATYEDWERRAPCGTKNALTARQLRDLVAELVEDGWLLKSRHRSPYHGYKTTLHLALSPAFTEEVDRWAKLGPKDYRRYVIDHSKPVSRWSLSWQMVVTPSVIWSAEGRHSFVNAYKSHVVGKSESQNQKTRWQFPVYTGILQPPQNESINSDSGEEQKELGEAAYSQRDDAADDQRSANTTAVQVWQQPTPPWDSRDP